MAKKTNKTILKETRKLLNTPGYFTQEAYARDAKDNCVNPLTIKACKFCLIGGLQRVTGCKTDTSLRKKYASLMNLISLAAYKTAYWRNEAPNYTKGSTESVPLSSINEGLEELNDSTNKKTIVRLLDRALLAA